MGNFYLNNMSYNYLDNQYYLDICEAIYEWLLK